MTNGWGGSPQEIAEIRAQLHICDYISWIMLAISTIAGALRIYVRSRLLKTFGWDDWAMVVAQFFFLGCVIIVSIVNSFSQHQYDGIQEVSISTFVWMARWGYGMYILTVIAIKISLALFMLRIFGPHHVWERIVIHTFTIIPAAIGIAALIIVNATCAVSFAPTCAWHRNFNITSLSFSFANSIADIAFAALSFLILWRMTMTRAAKISAYALFTIGTVGGLASVLRVVAYFQTGSDVVQQIRYSRWSMIEAGTCITAVCLFTLRPLVRQCNCFGSRMGSGDGSQARLYPYGASTILNKGHVAELQTHGLTEKGGRNGSGSVVKEGLEVGIVVGVQERADSRFSGVSQV
ncbi:hypothetical protein C1H76_0022 [Elsinoe australis]|uniref:Rhodopsin domain-containing protein n=1 Tax=Elsinoe australis TaxID=40998 RepID=A0A4U7B7Y8_9PEZI|nr:hypothetical protein C1H76_0022 [Elsinoe australis]